MRIALENDCVRIVDSVLSAPALRELRAFLRHEKLLRVAAQEWNPLFRTGEGSPAASSSRRASRASLLRARGPGAAFEPPLRPFLSSLRAALPRWLLEKSWGYLDFRLWAYDRGTALGWHSDASSYAGTFTFYVHDRWFHDWGGELLVLDRGNGAPLALEPASSFDYTFRDKTPLTQASIGTVSLPVPNRLVFIREGTPHRIAPVNDAAGNHARIALAGFFESKVSR